MGLNRKDIFGQKRLDLMFRLACSILGQSDEAQDMMQDVAEKSSANMTGSMAL